MDAVDDAVDAMDAMDAVDVVDVVDAMDAMDAVDAVDAVDARDAMDVERSDIPTNVGAMDAGAKRRPRTGDSRVGAVDAYTLSRCLPG
ncbi:MAG: hypothetical protein H6557_33165 [Lewinellaceae bacterium]|nr:hypothetical protein [Lewinellaceae bacterium]